MNNNILVIEDISTDIAGQLDCRKLEYNNQSKDAAIHDWLILNKSVFDGVVKLVIPCRLGNDDAEFMGLYVGLHIRLTKELESIRFVPILFLSESSKEDILVNQIENIKIKSALLLFTKGSYLFSSFDVADFISKNISPIDEKILLENIISNLNIENTRDTGHQLANEWGAFRLAKFAGYSISVRKPTSIFFKYKDSFTNNEIVPNSSKIIGLFDESCKALLIDDNAKSGWSEILEHILKKKIINPRKSTSLDIITTFEEAINFSDFQNYDIVFLDIRLLKEEDKANYINDINDFTGTKLLRKIKGINRGIQVIIFTASNKIWNIEKLLEIGANGYYIKESPEYILSTKFSKDNYDEFIKTIQACLLKKPLKKIYSLSENIKMSINELAKDKKIDKKLSKSIQQYINLGFKILEGAKVDNDFAMGYLVLFKCIELFNDNYIIQDATLSWNITIGEPLKQVKYKSSNDSVFLNPTIEFRNNIPSTFEKIAGFSSQVLNFSNDEILSLYHNVQRRNKFIHPDDGEGLTEIQKLANSEIFSYDGYLKLIESLNNILNKLKISLLTFDK